MVGSAKKKLIDVDMLDITMVSHQVEITNTVKKTLDRLKSIEKSK